MLTAAEWCDEPPVEESSAVWLAAVRCLRDVRALRELRVTGGRFGSTLVSAEDDDALARESQELSPCFIAEARADLTELSRDNGVQLEQLATTWKHICAHCAFMIVQVTVTLFTADPHDVNAPRVSLRMFHGRDTPNVLVCPSPPFAREYNELNASWSNELDAKLKWDGVGTPPSRQVWDLKLALDRCHCLSQRAAAEFDDRAAREEQLQHRQDDAHNTNGDFEDRARAFALERLRPHLLDRCCILPHLLDRVFVAATRGAYVPPRTLSELLSVRRLQQLC